MTHEMNLVVFPVNDLAQAKAIYGTLTGAEPYVDAPYYVGFRTGDVEIGLDPNGHRTGMTGPVAYWDVDDIHKALQSLIEAGATTQQDVKDVGGGKLTAWVKDADGNVIGIAQNP